MVTVSFVCVNTHPKVNTLFFFWLLRVLTWGLGLWFMTGDWAGSDKSSACCLIAVTAEWMVAHSFTTAVENLLYYICWNQFKVYTTVFAVVQWKTTSRTSCLLFLWPEISGINISICVLVQFFETFWMDT